MTTKGDIKSEELLEHLIDGFDFLLLQFENLASKHVELERRVGGHEQLPVYAPTFETVLPNR